MNKNQPSEQMQQLIDNFLASEKEFFADAEGAEVDMDYFIEFNDIKIETYYEPRHSRVDEFATITEHGEAIAHFMINMAR